MKIVVGVISALISMSLFSGCSTDLSSDRLSDLKKIQPEPGPQGQKGEEGSQGEKGDSGESGAQGTQGEKGEKGDAGPQGVAGPIGAQGAQGEKGEKGDTGSQGDAGLNGAQGAQGPQGVQGDKGRDGQDAQAYSLATLNADLDQCPKGGILYKYYVDADKSSSLDEAETVVSTSIVCNGQNGVDGTSMLTESGDPDASKGKNGDSWFDTLTAKIYKKVESTWQYVANLMGPKGDKGDQGSEGKEGANGSNGAAGAAGIDGLNGNHGAQGIQGIQGSQGAKGDKGDKGDKGSTGPQGAIGPAGRDGQVGSRGPRGYTIASSSRSALANECANGGQALEVWVDTNENGTYEVGVDQGFRTLLTCDGRNAPAMKYICHTHKKQNGRPKLNMWVPADQYQAFKDEGDTDGECP